MRATALVHTTWLTSMFAIGCTNSPVYLPSPVRLEGGVEVGLEGELIPATGSLAVPVVIESAEDAAERAALQADLPAEVEVPYVRVGDLAISVEWTITNQTDMPGNATVQLNGANQFFAYDPSTLVLGTGREAPQAPGLAGDTPIDVPARGSISGLFREDQLVEASIDLDQITRGRITPFKARLQINKHLEEFAQLEPMMFDDQGEPLPQAETGIVVPRVAIPQLLRVDLVFAPDRPMNLEFTVRVRDVRGELLPDLLLDAPVDELQPLAPMPFVIDAGAPPPA
jgi:hypothetical protein